MTAEHPEGGTLRQALERKIKAWHEEADKCADESRGPIHGSEYGNGVSAGLNYAADDLEALLEEHRPVDDPPGPTAKYPPSENNDV